MNETHLANTRPCWIVDLPQGYKSANFKVCLKRPAEPKARKALLASTSKENQLEEQSHISQYFGKEVSSDSIEHDRETMELLADAKKFIDQVFSPYDKLPQEPAYAIRFGIPAFIGIHDVHAGSRPSTRLALYDYIGGTVMHPKFLLDHLPLGSHREQSLVKRFFDISKALCRMLQIIHNQGLIHSLITTRNLLITTKGKNDTIWLVGFGYASSYDTRTRHPNSSDLKLSPEDLMFRAPECKDSKNHSAFWFPSDIYSVGAILLWLIINSREDSDKNPRDTSFLEILNRPPRDVAILKQQILEVVRKCRPDLYRGNENIVKILDTCLRYLPEERFSCVEELQDAIHTAERATGKAESTAELGDKVLAVIPPLPQELHPFFHEHFRQEANHLRDLYDRLDRHAGRYAHFEVYGNRDAIVNSLCRMLANAAEDDIYCTVTLPNYWTDTNLGSNGRFLTMNKHMARRQVKIKRLFLVTSAFHNLPEEEKQVLEWQYIAQKELQEEAEAHLIRRDGPDPMFEIRIARVDKDEVAQFEQAGSTVAYLWRPTGKKGTLSPQTDPEIFSTVCLNFHSISRTSWVYNRPVVSRQIQKLRYWTPRRAEQRYRRSTSVFEGRWLQADPLEKYIHPTSESLSDTSVKFPGSSLGEGVELLKKSLKISGSIYTNT